jgi:hypothetical protein
MKSLPIKTIALYILTSVLATFSYGTNYYVDPSSTSTTANGSLLYPWKTISQVNSGTTLLNPGDTVFFKRGQIYSGRLTVNRSGSSTAPIVYTNYGTGELPEFNNSVSGIINIYNKQYIVIDGFKIIDRSISETDHTVQAKISYAINIENSPYCTIRNCDISRVGVGISVTAGSNYTNIIGNYMHNMRMVRNTPTTVNPDDDYGANPMVIGTSNNLISNNRFEECWALSYDYGYDGGAVEFFGANMNNNKVIYNTAINCNGFIEIGSNTNGLAENNIIAYNKIINCGILGVYQNGATFTVAVKNLQYYNNTIVETIKQYAKPSVLFWMAGTGTPGMVTVKNNIFWLSSGVNVASSKFNSGQMIHTNNIYRMSSGLLGMTLNSSEILSNNASIFTNTTGDPANWNLQLPTGSIAINFGTTIGMNKDFAGNPIIDAPDAGIYESSSQIQKIISTPLNATISAGTISCFGGTTSVNVTASGGVLPYTGIGSFTVKAGTHTYIVTDAQGLKDTVSTTITEPKAIASSLTSGTISSSGGTTSIQVSTTGGTTPYSYSLNNQTFQSSNTFYGIAAGSYTVTTKDANGCTGSNSITINSYSTTLSYVRFKVRIYPNPTTNYFVLKISYFSKPETVFISVVDINGKIVETTSGDIYSTFYIGQNLNKGTYYIKVKVGTSTKTYSVMKI